ncbi:MAG: hypothetical protein ACREUP_09100, partial [Burkholderiales bacterium]
MVRLLGDAVIADSLSRFTLAFELYPCCSVVQQTGIFRGQETMGNSWFSLPFSVCTRFSGLPPTRERREFFNTLLNP